MKYNNLRTLPLNSNFLPLEVFPELGTISVKDAITDYLNGTCEVIDFYDFPILSNGKPIEHKTKGILFWPSVVMYKTYQKQKQIVRLTRANLYYRDHAVCCFCGDPLKIHELTMDHLLPKAKGGKTDWTNIVAACESCNAQKADSLPTGKWAPKRKPYAPSFYDILEIRKKHPLYVDHESWVKFLPNWESEIIVRDKHFRNPVDYNHATTNVNDNGILEFEQSTFSVNK